MPEAANLWMLRWDKTTFGLGLSNLTSQRTIYKASERADVMTPGLMTTGLETENTGESEHQHVTLRAPTEMPPSVDGIVPFPFPETPTAFFS